MRKNVKAKLQVASYGLIIAGDVMVVTGALLNDKVSNTVKALTAACGAVSIIGVSKNIADVISNNKEDEGEF